jgi:hypothetical protein
VIVLSAAAALSTKNPRRVHVGIDISSKCPLCGGAWPGGGGDSYIRN